MAQNRAAAEKYAIDFINRLDPSKRSGDLLASFFKDMDDAHFNRYVQAIKNGDDYLSVIMDNLNKSKITIKGLLAFAREVGCQMYHQVKQTDPSTGLVWLSGPKFLVIHLPVRRQIQTLVNKISIPEDNRVVDDLTDQPTGESKGASISSRMQYGAGFTSKIAKRRAMAVRHFSPPDSRLIERICLPGGLLKFQFLLPEHLRLRQSVGLLLRH